VQAELAGDCGDGKEGRFGGWSFDSVRHWIFSQRVGAGGM
jgi:hypothetical protein